MKHCSVTRHIYLTILIEKKTFLTLTNCIAHNRNTQKNVRKHFGKEHMTDVLTKRRLNIFLAP